MSRGDALRNICWFIGTVLAGLMVCGAVVCVIAAITEKNPWLLCPIPFALLLACGFYKAFTAE